MSRDNVELVQSICASWRQGDFSFTEWADPEIEYEIADGPTPGRWTGSSGMAGGWRSFLSAWGEFHAKMDEDRELDDERVLVLGSFGGLGKTSGVDIGQIESKGANLFHIRDGKVTRLVTYLDREHALEAVGLRK